MSSWTSSAERVQQLRRQPQPAPQDRPLTSAVPPANWPLQPRTTVNRGYVRPSLLTVPFILSYLLTHFPRTLQGGIHDLSFNRQSQKPGLLPNGAGEPRVCDTLAGFLGALKRTFDPVNSSREEAQQLSHLRQGKNSVCDYAIHFRTLAAESGWNNTALYNTFLKGLTPTIQDLLVPLDLPADLDALIALAIRTDNRRRQFQQQRESTPREPGRMTTTPASKWPTQQRSPPSTLPHLQAAPVEEPMHLGRARLTPEERQWRLKEGRCFYCGETGHLVSSCPAKKLQAVSQSQASKSTIRNLTKVKLNTTHAIEALIDSGADESLMDWGLAHKLNIESQPLANPIRARSLNGK